MKDKDKLHVAAILSGIVVVGVYLDNRHNVVIADHVLAIATYAIVAAVGGNIALSGVQNWIGGAGAAVQDLAQRFDPKDCDGIAE